MTVKQKHLKYSSHLVVFAGDLLIIQMQLAHQMDTLKEISINAGGLVLKQSMVLI